MTTNAMLSRRAALITGFATLASPFSRLARADAPDETAKPSTLDAAGQLDQVREIARKEKLGKLHLVKSTLFQVIGDGDAQFLRNTAIDCEAVAFDFVEHYRAKGFHVTPPKQHLTVVAASGRRSFVAFLGANPGPSVGGIYDRASNRLIVFDFRPEGESAPLRPGYANMLTLAHEATHQLTYNTGILSREADNPYAIVEGMAMYGEVRKFSGSTPPGGINNMRMEDLVRQRRLKGNDWIPLDRMLRNDDVLRGVVGTIDRRLQGYSQSWLLVYHLMSDPQLLPRFRDLLEALKGTDPRANPDRLALCSKYLGPIDRLDADLQELAIRLLKRNPGA
ncbi:DUF1570 domain-containing protein [Isosphaeraceae bacterium EP7]